MKSQLSTSFCFIHLYHGYYKSYSHLESLHFFWNTLYIHNLDKFSMCHMSIYIYNIYIYIGQILYICLQIFYMFFITWYIYFGQIFYVSYVHVYIYFGQIFYMSCVYIYNLTDIDLYHADIGQHTRHVQASHWDPSKLANFNSVFLRG